jgi:tetratricopeptide (TPR) repeat protein
MKQSAILLIVPCLLVGCATLEKNPRKEEAQARWEQMRATVKFQLAERSFEAGQVDQAMKTCQEVLALHPTHLEAYLLMTRIQLEKGQTAAAESTLDAIAEFGQDLPELDYLRGVLAERREQMPEALSWYHRAYEADSNDAEYLLAYAESMLVTGDAGRTAKLLRQRQHDFEQDVRVQLLLGQSLSLLGRHGEAGEAYLSVLRLEPNDPMLREEAGLVLLKAGRVREARLVLGPLLDSRQHSPSVALLYAWAKALLENDDPLHALSVLEDVTVQHPRAFAPWLLLSKAYLLLDQPTSARDAARRACSLEPDSSEARLLLAYCCLAAGDYDEAHLTAQQIIAAKPDDAQARLIIQQAIKR